MLDVKEVRASSWSSLWMTFYSPVLAREKMKRMEFRTALFLAVGECCVPPCTTNNRATAAVFVPDCVAWTTPRFRSMDRHRQQSQLPPQNLQGDFARTVVVPPRSKANCRFSRNDEPMDCFPTRSGWQGPRIAQSRPSRASSSSWLSWWTLFFQRISQRCSFSRLTMQAWWIL